jgi:surfeit locus 1 family protein
MRFSRFDFKPRLVPTLAALTVMVLTLALGRWQVHRAAEKEALQERWEQAASEPPLELSGDESSAERLRFRRVTAEGVFLKQYQILLDNRSLNDQPGFDVVAPLRIERSGREVLVNRGWVARGAQYRRPPDVMTPAGRVRVAGIATIPSQKFLELSSETIAGNVWQNLVLSRYRERTGLAVMPIVIVQQNPAPDGLIRILERPDAGIARHYGYAFQWFAIAAATLVTYVVVNTQRV